MNVEIINDNIDIDYLANVVRTSYYGKNKPTGKTHEDNVNTVKNCFNGGHMSVLEFLSVTFEIECPIFVARQLMRYRTFNYIEKSLRRTKPEKIDNPQSEIELHYNYCVDKYYSLLEQGYKKEDARQVLPLSTETTYIFQANLRNLYHMFVERSTPGTQHQTRTLVDFMKCKLFNKYPELQEILKLS